MKKRADFLAVRGGKRVSTAGFLIEGRARRGAATEAARFGYTITKKLGNAVTRNRMRRRLKAAVASRAPDLATAGFDYVLVARSPAATRVFAQLVEDLERALLSIHGPDSRGRLPKKDKT